MNQLEKIQREFEQDQRDQLFLATVVSNNSNEVVIQFDDGYGPTASVAKLTGVVVVAADRVLVARVGGNDYVVVDKVIHN